MGQQYFPIHINHPDSHTHKKIALKTNLGNPFFISDSSHPSKSSKHMLREKGAPGRGGQGRALLPSARSAPNAAGPAARGPVPRMILVLPRSMGAVCWQTEQIWIGKIHSWHGDTQLCWKQRRAARSAALAAGFSWRKHTCQGSRWSQRTQDEAVYCQLFIKHIKIKGSILKPCNHHLRPTSYMAYGK